MAGIFRRGAAALAIVASASLAATPVAARGWGGGWGGGHRHHDRGVDGGDILAGILIIGGIAAIASAASKANKQRQNRDAEPDPRYQPDTRDYGSAEDRSGADDRPEWREGSGIDTAVNRCIDEINRGATRVAQVDAVNRDDQGWRVTGTTTGNSAFSCLIDRDGRIRDVDVNGRTI